MRKQRKNIRLLGYDGKIKDGKLNKNQEYTWRTIVRFADIESARSAGATKLTPRYSRA